MAYSSPKIMKKRSSRVRSNIFTAGSGVVTELGSTAFRLERAKLLPQFMMMSRGQIILFR